MLNPLFALALALFIFLPQQQPTAPAAIPAPPAVTPGPPAVTPTPPATTPAPPATMPAGQMVPTVPPDAASMTNPVTPTADSQAQAKARYGYDCAMCHGDNGNGKGPVATDMNLPMKDFTDPAALKDVSDGTLFYIIKNGQGKMPGENGRAKPDAMWNLVIYVRSLSKK